MKATGLAGPIERTHLLKEAPSTPTNAGHRILAHLDRFSLRAGDLRGGDGGGGTEKVLTHKSVNGGTMEIFMQSPAKDGEQLENCLTTDQDRYHKTLTATLITP